MSGQHTTPAVGTASYVRPVDSTGMPDPNTYVPIRIQCAKCPNKVFKYIKVRTMYALPRNDSRRFKEGIDRQVVVEMWCLSCIRGANVEDDYQRTVCSIAQS